MTFHVPAAAAMALGRCWARMAPAAPVSIWLRRYTYRSVMSRRDSAICGHLHEYGSDSYAQEPRARELARAPRSVCRPAGVVTVSSDQEIAVTLNVKVVTPGGRRPKRMSDELFGVTPRG